MRPRSKRFIAGGLAIALVLALGLGRFASSEPDGLARVAADNALDSDQTPHALADGPFAGYSAPGVDDPGLATGLAGVVGILAACSIAAGLGAVASRASRGARSRSSVGPPAA